jgi:hypothetical protein
VALAVFREHPPGGTVLALHHKLGRAYLAAGLPDKAAGEFGIIARLLPDLVEVRLLLARSLAAAGRPEEAARSLRDALSLGVLDRETIARADGLDRLRADPGCADLFASTAR